MEKLIELECVVCCKVFERRKTEHKRNEKLRRRVYCSRECCGKDNINNIPKDKALLGRERARERSRSGFFKVDEFSPFRYHMRSIKNRNASKRRSGRVERNVDITINDLKELWEGQQGKCPYTGWNLVDARSMTHVPSLTPDRASVDRIDSSKGYTKDNIQFVSYMAQTAKNKFSETEFLDFCKAVVEHSKLL